MRFVNGPALVAGISVVVLTLAACGGQSVPAAATAVPSLPTEAPARPTEPPAILAPPSATSIPATAVPNPTTAAAATSTSVPATSTSVPTTSTAVSPTATSVPPTSTPEPQVADVFSDISTFVLEDLIVPVGTTVTWTNRDAAPHTTSSGKPPNRTTDIWRSGTLNTGDSHAFTFETAGEFAYFCEIHPGMTALVIVTESN